jgi:hypothetical protein
MSTLFSFVVGNTVTPRVTDFACKTLIAKHPKCSCFLERVKQLRVIVHDLRTAISVTAVQRCLYEALQTCKIVLQLVVKIDHKRIEVIDYFGVRFWLSKKYRTAAKERLGVQPMFGDKRQDMPCH